MSGKDTRFEVAQLRDLKFMGGEQPENPMRNPCYENSSSTLSQTRSQPKQEQLQGTPEIQIAELKLWEKPSFPGKLPAHRPLKTLEESRRFFLGLCNSVCVLVPFLRNGHGLLQHMRLHHCPFQCVGPFRKASSPQFLATYLCI